MLKVGFVGWRGLVGSVLLERMKAEEDFKKIQSGFFSTSNVGGHPPSLAGTPVATRLLDAFDIKALGHFDAIVTCQGGEYTYEVHPKLRASGWSGYWIDAASTLRMEPTSTLVLDPVNEPAINDALSKNVLDFCGANCTVSLMLMGLAGLFKANLVEWMTSMTYQAASGAGAEAMTELARQIHYMGGSLDDTLSNPAASALEVDRAFSSTMRALDFPNQELGVPLAGNLIPWIDKVMPGGQSREEWKAKSEGNKILGRNDDPIPMDGICVRVGTMRCHAQAFTIKLKHEVPLSEVESIIQSAHQWVEVVENTPEASTERLSPAFVTGSLMVPVGRLRTMDIGPEYLTAFSVGDQLLWGAAEPLRRMLGTVRAHIDKTGNSTRSVA